MKAITAEDRERLGSKTVVVGMSGGKDSTATAIYLRDNGIEFQPVFMDTGWEHQDTYTYLREVLDPMFGPIQTLRSKKWPGGLPDAVVDKAMWPSRLMRWCTQELKVFPLRDYIRGLGAENVVSAVGIRAAESRARSKMTRWEFDQKTFNCDVWRPIIDWSERDVINAHLRAGITPNPLYIRGAGYSRVGCYPCIMARKGELAQLAEDSPERIDLIRQLEAKVNERKRARKAAKGEPPPKRDSGMFQARSGGTGECWPIDKVIDWAKTARGGRQRELFAPSEVEEQGCVRWGLCESMQGVSDDE